MRDVDDAAAFGGLCQSAPLVVAVDTVARAGVCEDCTCGTLYTGDCLYNGAAVLEHAFVGVVLDYECDGVVVFKTEREVVGAIVVGHAQGIDSVPQQFVDVGEELPGGCLAVDVSAVLNFHRFFHIVVF